MSITHILTARERESDGDRRTLFFLRKLEFSLEYVNGSVAHHNGCTLQTTSHSSFAVVSTSLPFDYSLKLMDGVSLIPLDFHLRRNEKTIINLMAVVVVVVHLLSCIWLACRSVRLSNSVKSVE